MYYVSYSTYEPNPNISAFEIYPWRLEEEENSEEADEMERLKEQQKIEELEEQEKQEDFVPA